MEKKSRVGELTREIDTAVRQSITGQVSISIRAASMLTQEREKLLKPKAIIRKTEEKLAS